MKKVLHMLTWIICFYASSRGALISATSSDKEKLLMAFYIGLMFILIFLQVIYLVFNKAQGNTEKLITTGFPLNCFFMIIFNSHLQYGFGDTIGILGYRKSIGILSLFGVSYNAGAFCMFITNAITWIMISIKTYLALNRASSDSKRIKSLNKPVVWFVASVGFVLEIICIVYFIIFRELSNNLLGLFYTMPALYFCGYFLIFLISKCREFLVIDKKAN